MDYRSKAQKIAVGIMKAVFILGLFVGLLLVDEAKIKTEYPTSNYWVAKDYHHVYDKYTGRIEDMIGENETCEIKGDVIIVTYTKKGMHTAGVVLLVVFGIIDGIWLYFFLSDLYYEHSRKHRDE